MLLLTFNSFLFLLSFLSLRPLVSLATPLAPRDSPASTLENNDTDNKLIVQQDLERFPPVPILEIGLQNILGQIGANATPAGNASTSTIKGLHLLVATPQNDDTPVECSASQPCADGSCCNSEGKCGFMDYHCKITEHATCISNCDATANCGINSLYGAQKCPLNLCCSSYGYCGTSDLFCSAGGSTDSTSSCQQGFGSCSVTSPPSCDANCQNASRGKKLAYYQAANLRYRSCQRIDPEHINTADLTHLVYAFASIDPQTYQVVPAFPDDVPLYARFTKLKSSTLQTWIGIGGGIFSEPGPTYTTFSDICSNEANRAAFISSLLKFMQKYGFQGVDIDWEYPSVAERGGRPGDATNFIALLREMRQAFGIRYGISTVLPPDFYYLMGYNPIGMQPFVDFFNFMAYDLHGPWEAETLGAFIRPQTSIVDIASAMLPLWFDGVDPAKVNLGIAYYARGYTVSNTSCEDIGCPWTGPSDPGPCTTSKGVLSLSEVEDLIVQKNLQPKLIREDLIKQITFGKQWIGYDDDDTIALKTAWADQHCLGGTAVWSIDFYSGPGSGDTPTPVITGTSVDGSCGNGITCQGSPFGNCCSSHGWCGSSPDYCSPNSGCQPSFGTCSTSSFSMDGSCGNGISCLGSSFGDCCSLHGYCGSTDPYCSPLDDCQVAFGKCAALQPSVDGICGKNGKGCIGSGFGDCCSQYGWCGSSNDYCGSGCQGDFGICIL